MPPTLSLEDCLGESLRLALGELPDEQRVTMREMMLTAAVMRGPTYDAAVAQVERHGVWLPFPPATGQ
ncbi:hypothetical protein AKJ09_06743 [Labilithrix luteola]|uniref:Uncharacterized protein n=1 Tax=Labilithrix luteola TaxID=1391654 RepID=A0A0K1Q3W1_9BACT|nr:hypothetical protein [Labilithrix luteola]AKV00080.1 hypothetical protein AKJ09_06743 [Labilithrix luteola]